VTTPDTTSTADLSRWAGVWALDPAKTTIEFRTKALWFLSVVGTARALRGDARIGSDATVNGTFVVDAASFDTKNQKRDDHLRSKDFFEVARYPTVEFTVDDVRSNGADRVVITGRLIVRGTDQRLTLQADVHEDGSVATVSTTVEIDRSLWGLTWAKMGTGLKNQVTIRANFYRPDPTV
jgi:polyisoprenoid-binding protein YceI